MTALHHYWLRPANQLVPVLTYIAGYGDYVGAPAIGKEGALNALFDIMPTVNYWSDCTGTRLYSIVDADLGTFDITYAPCTNSVGVTGGGELQHATATLNLVS